MGKQHNKVQKLKRRLQRVKRKKAAIKAKKGKAAPVPEAAPTATGTPAGYTAAEPKPA